MGAAALCALLAANLQLNASTSWIPPRGETLSYDVMYKWGLINKKAGEVKLSSGVSPAGDVFRPQLTGATAPWADHFFEVRDTLRGTIGMADLLPLHYEKISHEGGDFEHDVLTYQRHSSVTAADAQRWRRKKKENVVTHSSRQHTASGVTMDMLSAYYFMRSLDYPSMKKGDRVKVNIFSGKRKERLTIVYDGMKTVKVQDRKIPSYHITFTFTSEDGKKTSDNMDAWISTGQQRIPLLLEGSLPIGKVRCFYSGTLPKE